MTDTDFLSDAQLDAIAALDVHLADDASIARGQRMRQAEQRRGYIVDYLLAAEQAEKAPKNTVKAAALDAARSALAAFLVGAGEYPTAEAAAAAADSRAVWAMPTGRDLSSEVPF